MFKKIISFTLILTLVLGSFTVAFAQNAEKSAEKTVTPQANMVTYHTLSPLVGKSSDYTTLDSTKKGSIGLEDKLIAVGVAGVTLLISKNANVASYVKAALDAATIGAGVYAAYKAYNAN